MKYHSTQKGFTLIEIIVSLGIFSIVALIAVGALLKITDANKKSQSLKTAINNINFVLESMSRELRVGTDYECNDNVSDSDFLAFNKSTLSGPSDCDDTLTSNLNWYIAFHSSKKAFMNGVDASGGLCNLIYVYRYKKPTATTYAKLEKAEQVDCNTPVTDADFYSIISPDVFIEYTTVLFVEAIKNFIDIRFVGYVGVKERNKSYFDIQTSISQR